MLCSALVVPSAYWSDPGTEKACSISQMTLYPRSTCSEWENTLQGWRGNQAQAGDAAHTPTSRRHSSLWTCAAWSPSLLLCALGISYPVRKSLIHSASPEWSFPGSPQGESKTSVGRQGQTLHKRIALVQSFSGPQQLLSLKMRVRGQAGRLCGRGRGESSFRGRLASSYLSILGHWECAQGNSSGPG